MGDTKTVIERNEASVLHPRKEPYHWEYSSAYDPYMFGNIMGMFSPTNQIGAIARATRGEGAGNSWSQRYFDNLLGLYDSTAAF